jgi:hypothetical protein
MHLGHKTGLGHDNMQHKKLRMIEFCMPVSCIEGPFLQHFVSE